MYRTRHGLRTRLILFGISCAVLLACSGALDAKMHSDGALQIVRLSREFKLGAGQRVALKGTKLRIKFVTVQNDSRCPSDVTCVWAGNAAVQFQLNAGRKNKTVTLNTSGNSTFVRAAEFQGYKVKLADLSPYPRSNRKIAAGDYTATLLVSKE